MTLITKTNDLEAFCKRASSCPAIMVDTEFVRETTYWPKLCLIQVGLIDEAVAIDPLAKGMDLSSFFELLQNPNIKKIFHAGRQDVEIFYHLTGQIPTPLFDTQIAAMVCGFGESVGYDVLVQKYAKISIDKSSRYTHWAQRPLSEKQLTYALGDVIHLRPVYEKIYRKVLDEDRLHWLEDELSILRNPATYAIDPYSVWKKVRVRSPKPRLLAILRELAAWREIAAQARNIPRGRLLREDAMVELAASAPQTEQDLRRLRTSSLASLKGNDIKSILELIKKATQLPLEDCPQIEKDLPNPAGASALAEMLRLLLKVKAQKYQVASKLIASNADLEVIARMEDPQVPALQGWRREVFGDAALALKAGKVAIGIKNHKVSLIPVE